MSQPAVALTPLPFELVYSDGEPLESEWHATMLSLLREVIRQVMAEQGRTDFYVGTDMFVYYSVQQAREVWQEEHEGKEKRAFRGPDVFWAGGVEGRMRDYWASWEEDGRLPDVIVELLSLSTRKKDRTEKKDLYEQVFGTAEYFLVDPERRTLEGFRLEGRSYRPIPPDRDGRLWSEQLGAAFGFWQGDFQGAVCDYWVRLFHEDGTPVPTRAEAAARQAEAERQRAEAQRQRADAAEAELARLRALLEEKG
jgi:Uma2 family endonuclease